MPDTDPFTTKTPSEAAASPVTERTERRPNPYWFFTLLLLSGVFHTAHWVYRLEDKGGFFLTAVAWAYLPALALTIVVVGRSFPKAWMPSYWKRAGFCLVVGLGPASAVPAGLIYVNDWAGSSASVPIRGTIIRSHDGHEGKNARIKVRTEDGRVYSLDATVAIVEKYPVGSRYEAEWRRGVMGLLYRHKSPFGEEE